MGIYSLLEKASSGHSRNCSFCTFMSASFSAQEVAAWGNSPINMHYDGSGL